MSDENQVQIPPSFVALFVPPGKLKPTESRAFITERYQLCEDLSQILVETAQTQRWSLGITTADVLERIGRGLSEMDLALTQAEQTWVLTRLAELLPPGD